MACPWWEIFILHFWLETNSWRSPFSHRLCQSSSLFSFSLIWKFLFGLLLVFLCFFFFIHLKAIAICVDFFTLSTFLFPIFSFFFSLKRSCFVHVIIAPFYTFEAIFCPHHSLSLPHVHSFKSSLSVLRFLFIFVFALFQSFKLLMFLL